MQLKIISTQRDIIVNSNYGLVRLFWKPGPIFKIWATGRVIMYFQFSVPCTVYVSFCLCRRWCGRAITHHGRADGRMWCISSSCHGFVRAWWDFRCKMQDAWLIDWLIDPSIMKLGKHPRLGHPSRIAYIYIYILYILIRTVHPHHDKRSQLLLLAADIAISINQSYFKKCTYY